MANYRWSNSSAEGNGLRIVFRKLIRKIDQEEYVKILVKLANAAAYVADKTMGIAFKTDRRPIKVARRTSTNKEYGRTRV